MVSPITVRLAEQILYFDLCERSSNLILIACRELDEIHIFSSSNCQIDIFDTSIGYRR